MCRPFGILHNADIGHTGEPSLDVLNMLAQQFRRYFRPDAEHQFLPLLLGLDGLGCELCDVRHEACRSGDDVLGSGVEVNLLEGLTLSAWRDGAGDPARFVWNVLAGRGQRLVKDGRTLESEAGNLTEIAERIEAFAAGRLLVLSQLGVAE